MADNRHSRMTSAFSQAVTLHGKSFPALLDGLAAYAEKGA
jgi:hypothetical protein